MALEKQPRILFFDALRIISVLGVVVFHVAQRYNIWWLCSGDIYWNVILFSPGVIGTYLLIFISGAVIEYSHNNIKTFKEYIDFIARRVQRIYPAYWISLILTVALAPPLITTSLYMVILEISGFCAFTGNWGGPINVVGWFIGLIIVLYMIYPYLSWMIKKYPVISMMCLFIITYLTRATIISYHIGDLGFGRWFPLANLFEFALGIFIVQKKFYPKNINKSKTILFLSDLSFYVFLIHAALIDFATKNLIFYIGIVLLFSIMMHLIDQWIQFKIKLLDEYLLNFKFQDLIKSKS